ncbi:MAG: bifunctional copper resistance protein CopD/cytochrome c oxidase assembly protein [Actinomycetota bacterium]|nr:bifunctional copper resistance protein CopD/cytochrome c oxidase assembly protein [Actinomycetota bacterium]
MSRSTRWVAASFLAALAVLVIALEFGGGAPQAVAEGIPDPGVITGWGLPLIKLVTDVAAVTTIGFLVATVFLLPSSGDSVQGLSVTAARIASRCAAVWAASTGVLYFLTVSDYFAVPLHRSFNWAFASSLVTDQAVGRGILGQAVVALAVALAARWTIGVRSLALVLGLALAGLAPVSLTGHAASSGSHSLATTSLLLHIVGASLWVGGLVALGWVAVRGSKRLDPAIQRFSILATWCLGLVAISGATNAAVRLGSVDKLFGSDYGILVIGKIVAIVSLALFGLRQRRRIASQGKGFVRLAGLEILVMAMTIGLAVALSRTPTPVPGSLLKTPVEELLGGVMPPEPTVLRLLWGWSPNGVGLALVALGAAFYIRGLITMRRRGDSWPINRTLSWFAGLLIVAWASFGGLGTYSHVLFSAHMVSHMMLSMVAPIFLILAAPVTLALRTLPGPRQPGEIGPRQLLLAFLHSRFSQLVTHPLVGPALFISSLYGLYFTGIFETLMRNHWGHSVMELHFLAVGSLYYYVLIGIDPAPRKLQPLVRFGMLLVTIPFHAFFSIAVMSSNTIFAGEYWEFLHRPYQTDLLADQYLGGGIAWAMGEIPLLLVMGAIFVQWFKSDRRESRRFDRAESNSDDHDLEAYNAYLASLNAHGKRRDTHEM